MSKDLKGVIGVPTSERNNFSWSFIESLLRLKTRSGAAVTHCNIGILDVARNQLIYVALNNKCDYICMMDSDMVVPADGIEKLLATMEKFDAHIGTGLYFMGSEPHHPVAYDYINGAYVPITKWDEPRLVDGCGMGFCVIKKELFGIKYAFVVHENKLLGEDITFCHRARLKGYKIVLDPTVKLGHLRMIEVNEEYANNVNKNKGK